MWNDEATFAIGIVAFFVALVVEWYLLWYLFGRHKDGRSIRRYRVWNVVCCMATVLLFWFVVFGPSWKVALLIAAMVALWLCVEVAVSVTCPSCKEPLRNPEWPKHALAYCYKCGARLDQLPERAEAEASPPQN